MTESMQKLYLALKNQLPFKILAPEEAVNNSLIKPHTPFSASVSSLLLEVLDRVCG